jgi:hypothetical protein
LKSNSNENVIDVKLRLCPRFGNTWVHYDHELFRVDNGKSVGELRSATDWGTGGATFPSWRVGRHIIKYIISPDKKQWRAEPWAFHEFWDKEMHGNMFEENIYINSQFYKIVDVEVINPPYVCPQTGFVWKPRERDKILISKRLWLFKIAPKDNSIRHVINDEITPYRGLEFKSKTAYMSGLGLMRSCYFCDEDFVDHRAFLYEKAEVSRISIVKSAARYIKKTFSVTPISKATRMFFQNLGALAHLMKSQKYAKSTT